MLMPSELRQDGGNPVASSARNAWPIARGALTIAPAATSGVYENRISDAGPRPIDPPDDFGIVRRLADERDCASNSVAAGVRLYHFRQQSTRPPSLTHCKIVHSDWIGRAHDAISAAEDEQPFERRPRYWIDIQAECALVKRARVASPSRHQRRLIKPGSRGDGSTSRHEPICQVCRKRVEQGFARVAESRS